MKEESTTPADVFKRTTAAFEEAKDRVSNYSIEERARLSDAARQERAGQHGIRRSEIRSH